MFFDDWMGLVRVVVVGTLAYAAVVLLLRTTGKRTLSKMNAFDLIVTVALGSTLATVLLSETVALAEGVTAFVLLVSLQFVVAWLSARWPSFRGIVKAEPRLLLHRGRMLNRALRDERVAHEEVLAAARSSGFARLDEVEAVVLETDGTFSVVGKPDADADAGAGSDATALSNVNRPPGTQQA
jgi:uncharacterized membrane protein YcaP (DUF421 family)